MKNFVVTVCKISYGHHEIEVEAENEDQAKDIALDTALDVAGNYTFPENSSDYEIVAVSQCLD